MDLGPALGFLDYENDQMCAVCTQHDPNDAGKPCMRFRKLKRGSIRYRPSAALTAWLRAGQRHPDRSDRAAHMGIELRTFEFDEREDARSFLESHPKGREFTEQEGEVPAGESAEPRDPIV